MDDLDIALEAAWYMQLEELAGAVEAEPDANVRRRMGAALREFLLLGALPVSARLGVQKETRMAVERLAAKAGGLAEMPVVPQERPVEELVRVTQAMVEEACASDEVRGAHMRIGAANLILGALVPLSYLFELPVNLAVRVEVLRRWAERPTERFIPHPATSD